MTMPYVYKIDDEARILSKYPTDLDNYRRFYTTKEINDFETINITFCSPSILAMENNRFYLLKNSNLITLKPSRYYRPDYVSYDEYGTTNLWPVLLFINNISSIEDFDVEEILIPTKEAINTLSNRIAELKINKEIVPLYDLPLKPTPSLFSSKKLIPTYQTNTSQPAIIPAPSSGFIRETLYTVDVVMARQRYVNLTYEPIPATVTIVPSVGGTYFYDKHYAMVKGKSGYNKLTWDPKILSGGIGMVSVLIEGVQFEVTYTRKS